MKLATLKNNHRDGQLVLVDTERQKALPVPSVAATLQDALDQWATVAPQLNELYSALCQGSVENTVPFDEAACASPLPRAYQWADGSAYVNHVELVRKARGADMPESFWTDPLMYQGGSDAFLSPRDPIRMQSTDWGIDLEAEIAVITDDVPQGVSVAQAGTYIRLMMLVNDVSLRGLIPQELAKGFGFFQSKPSSAFSPIALTPEMLGDAWSDYKVHLPLLSYRNQELLGQPNAGEDMTFNFAQLIAHAAKSRPLTAGTIIGSGTVSNSNPSVGSSCIAEVRMLETIRDGKPTTEFLQFGETVSIKMLDADGHNLFGTIHQSVEKLVC